MTSQLLTQSPDRPSNLKFLLGLSRHDYRPDGHLLRNLLTKKIGVDAVGL